MVKLLMGFICGIISSGILLFGIQAAIPTRAQTEDTSPTSENVSLVKLLPDLEKIYHEALTSPLREAEKKIYDPDVAQFYHHLLQKTELDR